MHENQSSMHDKRQSENEARFTDCWAFSERPAAFDTTSVPAFDAERRTEAASADQTAHRTFTYAITGALGVAAAIAAKSCAVDALATLGPSQQALSGGVTEVDLAAIPVGKNAVVKWRGKPVFIRHRTPAEIATAANVEAASLRDPQTDAERTRDPRFLVLVGICTHLGCVPIGEAGDFGGWFCPCHGSHYDVSGRVRQGPAPRNMEIPPYRFIDANKIVIG